MQIMMGSNQTKLAIKLAISRITKGRPKNIQTTRKLSIAAVAEEAGISNATIHNRYPDLAELIRQKINKKSREKLVQKNKALQGADLMLKELRQVLTERDAELKRIAIVNLRLSTEKKILQEENALLNKKYGRLESTNRELLAKLNSPRGEINCLKCKAGSSTV
jgi:AcrR family transcriptional regulator